MVVVQLNTKLIIDKASFHLVCKEAFGFPSFHGRNMDAWIDCMSYFTKQEAGMTGFVLAEDEMLHIEITDTEDFNSRQPKIFDDLVECSAFVNNRYIKSEGNPKISLIFL